MMSQAAWNIVGVVLAAGSAAAVLVWRSSAWWRRWKALEAWSLQQQIAAIRGVRLRRGRRGPAVESVEGTPLEGGPRW